MTRLPFPDIYAARLTRDAKGALDRLDFATFNPDVNEDGRPQDYGQTLIEGGYLVADLTDEQMLVTLALLEQSPVLHHLVTQMVAMLEVLPETDGPYPRRRQQWLDRAKHALADIARGKLVYDGR